MSNTGGERNWTLARYSSWALATGSTGALVGVLTSPGGAIIDDEAAQLGFVVGAVLGLVGARKARKWQKLHRVLVGLGILFTVIGTAGAVWQFMTAGNRNGELYSGLGEVIGYVFAIGIAVIGALWLAAGATGLRSARA